MITDLYLQISDQTINQTQTLNNVTVAETLSITKHHFSQITTFTPTGI